MKNSILFVSGTLWALSCLVGKSCPSVIYPFNTDDSNDGAILTKNSNKLDLSRDLSQPIIARFARDVTGEDPTESQSSKFHLLIIIIPVVMGVVVIFIIVLVACYMCRRSERGTCISNEWLIWCGLMKRSNPSSVREPGDHMSANASDPTSVRREVTYTTGQSRMTSTHGELLTESHNLQTPQPVERENHTGARPSERSPSLPNTPNTGNSSLPTDDELDHSRTPKFTYPDPEERHIGRIAGEQTRVTHEAMYQSLDNIPENESIGGGRDNGKAVRSRSDSPGDTYQVISGNDVHVYIYSPVDTVHVGDKKTKHIFFPKDSTDTINNNSCAFNRFSRERKTH